MGWLGGIAVFLSSKKRKQSCLICFMVHNFSVGCMGKYL